MICDCFGQPLSVGDKVFGINDRRIYYVIKLFNKDIQIYYKREPDIPLYSAHVPTCNYIKVNDEQAEYIQKNIKPRT